MKKSSEKGLSLSPEMKQSSNASEVNLVQLGRILRGPHRDVSHAELKQS